MSGTFTQKAEGHQDESYGSGNPDTGSTIAQVDCSNNTVEKSKNEQDEINAKFFAPKPHPFSFKTLTSDKAKEVYESIELKKNRLQYFDAFDIMAGLSWLEHAKVSKDVLLSCPIMAQVRDLKSHRIPEIAAHAARVLLRIEPIISSDQDRQLVPPFMSDGCGRKATLQTPIFSALFASIAARPSTTVQKTAYVPMPARGGASKDISEDTSEDTSEDASGDTTDDDSDAVPPAQLSLGQTIPKSSETSDASTVAALSGLPGLNVTGEQLPLQCTIPLQKVEAKPKMTSKSPAVSFGPNMAKIADISSAESRSSGPKKGTFSPLPSELRTKQSDLPYNKPLFGNHLEQQVPSASTSQIPDVSSGLSAEIQINTREDFFASLKTFIDLDNPRMDPLRDALELLWKTITSVLDNVNHEGVSINKTRIEVRRRQMQIDGLQLNPNADPQAMRSHQEDFTETGESIGEHRLNIEKLRSDLLEAMSLPLQKLVIINKEMLDQKQTEINNRRGQIVTLVNSSKRISEMVISAAKGAETELATVQERLDTVDKERIRLQTALEDLQNKSDKENAQLMKKNAALSEEVHAQSDQIRIKSREHAKAMGKVDGLERWAKSLKKDKLDLNLANTTKEKELEDLKTRVENLKSYEEGYAQIKRELEDLQILYNDAVFERDSIQKRLDGMAIVEKGKEPAHEPKPSSSHVTPAAPPQRGFNPATAEERLDGLRTQWMNTLIASSAILEEKQDDIEAVDAEIERVRSLIRQRG